VNSHINLQLQQVNWVLFEKLTLGKNFQAIEKYISIPCRRDGVRNWSVDEVQGLALFSVNPSHHSQARFVRWMVLINSEAMVFECEWHESEVTVLFATSIDAKLINHAFSILKDQLNDRGALLMGVEAANRSNVVSEMDQNWLISLKLKA
jgi:hypothetical protein